MITSFILYRLSYTNHKVQFIPIRKEGFLMNNFLNTVATSTRGNCVMPWTKIMEGPHILGDSNSKKIRLSYKGLKWEQKISCQTISSLLYGCGFNQWFADLSSYCRIMYSFKRILILKCHFSKAYVMICTSAIKDGRSYDVSSMWDRLDFLLTSLGYILVYQRWSLLWLYTCKLAKVNILMF